MSSAAEIAVLMRGHSDGPGRQTEGGDMHKVCGIPDDMQRVIAGPASDA
jgi:hypothetical protein